MPTRKPLPNPADLPSSCSPDTTQFSLCVPSFAFPFRVVPSDSCTGQGAATCQTDRPIVERRFHRRFSSGSNNLCLDGLRFERPAGAAAETFGISSILCRTRDIRASSNLKCDSISQATSSTRGYSSAAIATSIFVCCQSGISTSMTEAISHIEHPSFCLFVLNMESQSSLPYLSPYLVAVL